MKNKLDGVKKITNRICSIGENSSANWLNLGPDGGPITWWERGAPNTWPVVTMMLSEFISPFPARENIKEYSWLYSVEAGEVITGKEERNYKADKVLAAVQWGH